MLLLGNSLMSEMVAYSVMFRALVFLEINHSGGQLELLCTLATMSLNPNQPPSSTYSAYV